jgi:hypothetical protein
MSEEADVFISTGQFLSGGQQAEFIFARNLDDLVFRGYAAESRWLSRTSGNRSQMAWSG